MAFRMSTVFFASLFLVVSACDETGRTGELDARTGGASGGPPFGGEQVDAAGGTASDGPDAAMAATDAVVGDAAMAATDAVVGDAAD